MKELKEKAVFKGALDFRPKCPIVRNESNNVQNECGGALCSWYDKENKQCAILSIAKYLDRLHSSTIKH